MTSADLHVLLDYHYWSRDRVLKAAGRLSADDLTRDVGSSFKSVRDTLVHLYSAEWVLCSVWRGTSPTAHVPADRFRDVPSLRSAWTALEVDVRAVMTEIGDDVTREIVYSDLAGIQRAMPFWQMIQHLVNHASYHRGQVTTMLRQMGARAPQSMDLMAFYRVRT